MFMGDAGVDKEKDILDKYNLSNVDVLKVGHHGSKTSSSRTFIDEINPKYSIISVGKNNRYRHPNKEVLNNLENSKIYRTDQNGSIMFKIKNYKFKIFVSDQGIYENTLYDFMYQINDEVSTYLFDYNILGTSFKLDNFVKSTSKSNHFVINSQISL